MTQTQQCDTSGADAPAPVTAAKTVDLQYGRWLRAYVTQVITWHHSTAGYAPTPTVNSKYAQEVVAHSDYTVTLRQTEQQLDALRDYADRWLLTHNEVSLSDRYEGEPTRTERHVKEAKHVITAGLSVFLLAPETLSEPTDDTLAKAAAAVLVGGGAIAEHHPDYSRALRRAKKIIADTDLGYADRLSLDYDLSTELDEAAQFIAYGVRYEYGA